MIQTFERKTIKTYQVVSSFYVVFFNKVISTNKTVSSLNDLSIFTYRLFKCYCLVCSAKADSQENGFTDSAGIDGAPERLSP